MIRNLTIRTVALSILVNVLAMISVPGNTHAAAGGYISLTSPTATDPPYPIGSKITVVEKNIYRLPTGSSMVARLMDSTGTHILKEVPFNPPLNMATGQTNTTLLTLPFLNPGQYYIDIVLISASGAEIDWDTVLISVP